MGILKTTTYFADLFPLVLATSDGMRSPGGVDIDAALVSQYAGSRNILQKILPPATVAAAVPGSRKFRALPRTRLTASSLTSSAILNVTKHTAQFFVPGDALTACVPNAQITFAAAYLAGETVTISAAGRTFSYVVPTPAPVDNTALVADIAAKLAKSALNGIFEAFGNGAVLNLISVRDELSAFTVAETSTAGTALPATGTLAYGATAIGTVLSVNYNPDTDVHQITLTANAAVALGAGMPIGDMRYSPVDLGVMVPDTYVDLLNAPNTYVACFIACTLYKNRMPYWDGQLKVLFPEIKFV
jgi:hypothetical protein